MRKPRAKAYRKPQCHYETSWRESLVTKIKVAESVSAVTKKHHVKCSSPAMAVPEPGTDLYRCTLDSRGVNQLTFPITSSMNDLKWIYRSVCGSDAFVNMNMCHTYLQVSIIADLQEVMSIKLSMRECTFSHFQLSTNSWNHFQVVMLTAF